MKIKFFFGVLCILFLASCSSSRKISTKKNNNVKVVKNPINKLPSVRQQQHVKKLEKGNKSLNKHTLQYIKKYAPLAVLEMHKYDIPASITLAQGILESGNGRSQLASKSNNHFGIKCHTGWKGQKVYHDDDEKGECFRKYKFVETSYKDHSEFLSGRRRYANLFKLRKSDYKGWAKGLKKAGYATDKNYPKKLIKIIETYELYEFDKIREKDLKRVKKETSKTERKPKIKTKKRVKKYYEVKKGDTLYSIARKYETSVTKLKKVNALTGNTLSIGQKLLIN
ncbi:glucosaminidase domain-containing protein [Flavobacteriaceae bacterium]|nr:glucosaminidase domain-containing protein [Flavobacteriaceae bacterium]MDB4025016.1 glucosaminidase domain-containing protein [Flavobacteriaceae bacterium]MDB9781200.1 glucosaminidase domain-containing protein [Flavobacteriaceae bacterium]